MTFDALEEVELIVGAHKVVGGVLTLPVLVAAQIIPQETYALHVWEEGHGVWQVLHLDG